jgi:hypothetical protein
MDQQAERISQRGKVGGMYSTYLGDEQDGLEGVHPVGVGWRALAELDGGDARAPHVRAAVVRRLADHLHGKKIQRNNSSISINL